MILHIIGNLLLEILSFGYIVAFVGLPVAALAAFVIWATETEMEARGTINETFAHRSRVVLDALGRLMWGFLVAVFALSVVLLVVWNVFLRTGVVVA